jgi:hypothetical protein
MGAEGWGGWRGAEAVVAPADNFPLIVTVVLTGRRVQVSTP